MPTGVYKRRVKREHYCLLGIMPYERFLAKIKVLDNGCWFWTGFKEYQGYGRFWNGFRHLPAHRYSYNYYIGDIPKGLVIDHLCRNTSCVNPSHLEIVTNKENIMRGSYHGLLKTHCKNGHPYNGNNVFTNCREQRRCRICAKEASERWRNKNHKGLPTSIEEALNSGDGVYRP